MGARQFAVIGLGRFGSSIARSLATMGRQVLGIDRDRDRVHELADEITHVVQADATDPDALKEIGILEFDTVIVAIGGDIQDSIMITLILKELGTKQVIAKATNTLHGKVLARVGADRVVFPERDMGERVARSLGGTHILDYFELDPRTSIVEVTAPTTFTGKTLAELDLREQHGVNVVCIKKDHDIDLAPRADTKIEKGDVLVLSGKNERLDALTETQ